MADTTTDGTHLTKAGFLLLAKALAGKTLTYTKISLGNSERSGNVVYPTRAQQFEFTSLINPKMTLPLIDVAFTGGGCATVKGKLSNATLAEGFFNRELGLFAKDPDTGNEVLYCYRNIGDYCDYVPPSDSTTVFDTVIAVVTVVQEAANVTAIIDASLAYVTQSEFAEHVDSATPHPNAPSLKGTVTTTDNFWVTSNDKHLHPMTTANVRTLILGDDANTLPQLNKRVIQTEINIANLYMQLNAEREIGLQPNLLLMEDFSDSANIDTYNAKIITTVAGVRGVQIPTDEGILAGHWYTITDGVRDEYVRVKSVAKKSLDQKFYPSVAKNDGAIVAIFDNVLTNTYTLANAQLMRSTALIRNGNAQGSGRFRTGSWGTAMTEWKGLSSNTAATLTLGTTLSNAAAFEIEGEGGFTTNGEFTIA